MAASPAIVPIPPCDTNPAHPTDWVCEGCGAGWCSRCVKRIGLSRRAVEICARCQGRCVPVDTWIARQAGGAAVRPAREAWSQTAAEAWRFPLRDRGWVVLVTGGLLFGVLDAAAMLVGALTLGFGAFLFVGAEFVLFGYVARFWMETIRTSANDLDAPLDWPDPELGSGLVSLIRSALVVYVTPLALLLPAMLARWFAPLAWRDAVAFALAGVALFFLPMAYITVAMYDSLAGLNPIFLIVSIGRVLGAYAGLVLYGGAVAAAIYGLRHAIDLLAAWGLAATVLGTLAGAVLSLYLLSVTARLLGRFYHEHAARLNW